MSLREEVNAVLAESTTKQTKRRKLINLGLQRFEVTALLANVPEVRRPRANNARENSVFAPTFNADALTFGVEIECINVERSNLICKARNNGLEVHSESYNHTDNTTHFKIVSDASLCGYNSNEIVSPILRGESGLNALKMLCKSLDETGAKINRSCGLHVHFGAANTITEKHVTNIFNNYKKIQRAIEKILPPSRNDGRYCKHLDGLNLEGCESISQLQSTMRNDRYFYVNIMSYLRHGTIEFRQHSGTVEYKKIFNWLKFLRGLIAFSFDNRMTETINNPLDLPWVASDNELKAYVTERYNKFNH